MCKPSNEVLIKIFPMTPNTTEKNVKSLQSLIDYCRSALIEDGHGRIYTTPEGLVIVHNNEDYTRLILLPPTHPIETYPKTLPLPGF